MLAAGNRSSPDSDKALESLCRTYWYPLYAYVRRRVADVHEAQDLTQEFFTRLLEKNYVALARPERGRFRSFLLTAFNHFLVNEWEKAKAQKRGGGHVPISLDFDSADSRHSLEPTESLTAERLYEKQWVLTLIDGVWDRLQEEFAGAGKAKHFEHLKAFIYERTAPGAYAEAARESDVTEGAARVAAHRTSSCPRRSTIFGGQGAGNLHRYLFPWRTVVGSPAERTTSPGRLQSDRWNPSREECT